MKIKAILMTAAMAFVSTMAMAQAKLTAEPLNVVPGEEFTLPVYMTSDNQASTISMTITGSEGLNITKVTRGEGLKQKDEDGERFLMANSLKSLALQIRPSLVVRSPSPRSAL